MHILTEKQLSKKINIHRTTLHYWRVDGGLPFIQEKKGHILLYDFNEVLKWLKKNRKKYGTGVLDKMGCPLKEKF